MKTVQIIGEHLHENLLVAMTSSSSKPSLLCAIIIKFIEDGDIQEAKLVLHTKETLQQEDFGKAILSFTGTVITEKSSRLCMGCHYTDNPIQECWMTIIEPTTEVFKTNIKKTKFIEECKKYYQHLEIEFSDDGNLIKGFPLFRKESKATNPSGLFRNSDNSVEIYTEMKDNLFPIVIKKDGKNESFFGEFIDEETVRTCSKDEAFLRGVNIC